MAITTNTEERLPCPAIDKHCQFYGYQTDDNDEVVITVCGHPQNDDTEGNTIKSLCPLIGEPS